VGLRQWRRPPRGASLHSTCYVDMQATVLASSGLQFVGFLPSDCESGVDGAQSSRHPVVGHNAAACKALLRLPFVDFVSVMAFDDGVKAFLNSFLKYYCRAFELHMGAPAPSQEVQPCV
jgi:hypothetical protein